MRALLMALAVALTTPALAGAQAAAPPTLPRGDVQAAVGWQNVHEPNGDRYNDWLNSIATGSVAAGYYWTEHLRTYADFSVGTEGTQYRADAVFVDGQQTFGSARLFVQHRSVAVGQQYQFFHNALFHPHVGGGAIVSFERRRTEFSQLTAYDPVARATRLVRPAHAEGPETHAVTRPFVEAGFKAYLSPRAYFVHDTRFVASSRRLEQVTLTFGFGVDF